MEQGNDVGTATRPRRLEVHLYEDRWGNHRARVVCTCADETEEFLLERLLSPPGEDVERERLSNTLPEVAAFLDRRGL